ncbi:MAG: O-antigen ligase family protein, partial [Candidatus Binatia bacterium]
VVAWYPWEDEMRALRWLVAALTAVAVAEALYAFVQQSTDGGRILWLACPAHASCAGTYLNRNHYAGLLEMTFPLVVARAVAGWLEQRHRHTSRGGAVGWMRRTVQILNQLSQPAAGRTVSVACLGLLVLVAMAASGSRSPFFATVGAFAVTLSLRRTGRNQGRIVAYTAVAMVVALWLAFPQFRDRLGTGDLARPAIAADTIDMAGNFPLFGVGLGNFGAVFPLYRGRTIKSWAFGVDVDHAHNDYLEWISEVGVPAAAVTLGLVIMFGRRVARALRNGAMTTDASLLQWGFATGALALLLHSFTDFNLHIPANALVFAFLIGGLIRLTRPATLGGKPARAMRVRATARTPALVALLLSAYWGAATWYQWEGAAAFHHVYPDEPMRNLLTPHVELSGSQALDLMRRAAALLPAAPEVQSGLARQLEADGSGPGDNPAAASRSDAAMVACARSLWGAPLQPRVLLDLAAAAAPTRPAASGLLQDLVDRAVRLTPYDPEARLEAADWHLRQWDTLRGEVRQHAREQIDSALALAAGFPDVALHRQATSRAYQRIVGTQDAAASAPPASPL